MSLLVTGSIGIDTVKTPYGVSRDCVGGSAVYFSMAASFFSPVRFLGAIGADCPFDLKKVFKGRRVDLAGLEVREKSRTFRWSGSESARQIQGQQVCVPGQYRAHFANRASKAAKTATIRRG